MEERIGNRERDRVSKLDQGVEGRVNIGKRRVRDEDSSGLGFVSSDERERVVARTLKSIS